MSKLQIEIANLESILVNCRDDHTPEELKEMEEDLAQYSYVQGLWEKYLGLAKSAGSILEPFHPDGPDGTPSATERVFPAGVPCLDVLRWFESRFAIDVRVDLGYDGPWGAPGSAADAAHPRKSQLSVPNGIPDDEKERIYLEILARKLVEDAQAHAEALLAEDPELLSGLVRADYAAMAARFRKDHDPSRPDNEQWDEIVWEIANERKGEK